MKLALITGGSKGLGKALLNKFKNNGFEVFEFSRSGNSRANIYCDFNNYEQASIFVEENFREFSEKKYSDLVLVNNVGTIEPIGPIHLYSSIEYQNHINVNFLSTIMVTGMFTKYFQEHPCNKTIISISSGAAIKPKHGWAMYCAVKAGLEQFMRTYSLEQSSEVHPISGIICDPGIVDTDMQNTIRSISSTNLFPEKQRFINFKEEKKLKTSEVTASEIFEHCLNSTKSYVKL